MKTRMTVVIAAGLMAAACSNEGAPTETEAAKVETAAAEADDDTLEPEAPKVEQGEEHNEDAPHSH